MALNPLSHSPTRTSDTPTMMPTCMRRPKEKSGSYNIQHDEQIKKKNFVQKNVRCVIGFVRFQALIPNAQSLMFSTQITRLISFMDADSWLYKAFPRTIGSSLIRPGSLHHYQSSYYQSLRLVLLSWLFGFGTVKELGAAYYGFS